MELAELLAPRRGAEGADIKSKDSSSRLWSKFYIIRAARLLCGAPGAMFTDKPQRMTTVRTDVSRVRCRGPTWIPHGDGKV